MLFGDYTISPEVASVQQGNPLGCFLFCIGMHPILNATKIPIIHRLRA
jgi:hypothetical protein